MFASTIVQMGKEVTMQVVLVPPEIAEVYVAAGTRRVVALLNGEPVRRYLFRSADGEFGIIVGKSVIRDYKLPIDAPLIVEMWADPHPDRVDLCEEMVVALKVDSEAGDRFYSMSPGKQRSLALYVCSAKRPATRERRAVDIARRLRTYTLQGDKAEDG